MPDGGRKEVSRVCRATSARREAAPHRPTHMTCHFGKLMRHNVATATARLRAQEKEFYQDRTCKQTYILRCIYKVKPLVRHNNYALSGCARKPMSEGTLSAPPHPNAYKLPDILLLCPLVLKGLAEPPMISLSRSCPPSDDSYVDSRRLRFGIGGRARSGTSSSSLSRYGAASSSGSSLISRAFSRGDTCVGSVGVRGGGGGASRLLSGI